MAFDPTQPFTVEDSKVTTEGFDPNKPFEVVAPEQKARERKRDIFDQAAAVGKAALRGYQEGFEGTPRIPTPEAQDAMTRAAERAGVKGAGARVLSTLLEDLHAPLAVGPGLFRGAQAAVQQIGKEAGDERLGREIAAIPEAFMGMPRALRSPEARPGTAPRARVEPGFPEPPAGPQGLLTGPTEPPLPGGPPALGTPPARLSAAEPPVLSPEPPPPAPGAPPGNGAGGGLVEAKGKIQQGVALAQRYADEITQLRQQGATPEMLVPAIQRNRAHLQELQAYAEQVRDLEKGSAPQAPGPEPNWYQSYLDGIRSLIPEGFSPAAQPTADPPPVAAQAEAWMPVADAPVEQPTAETPAAVQEPPAPPLDTAHGGPWVRVKTKAGEDASNRQGEALYENPNGVRATFENNVPYTESTTEHPEKGLVPRNVMDRRGQFLTAEETGLGAAPPKARTESEGKPGGKAGELEAKPPENPKVESRPKPVAKKPAETKPEWTEIGKNADGLPVFTNEAGVHSTVESGIRTVEPVRMRPTREGMRVSVPAPADKAPEFQVASTSGSSTTKAAAKPEASAESTPAEKPRREYDTRLTKPEERAANKLAVDALNGDITEKEAVAGLGKMVRDGLIPEGVAQVNLNRLGGVTDGEWEAAKAPGKPAGAPTPTEHPSLVIKSLETGKETVIQPPDTVAPTSEPEADQKETESGPTPETVTHTTRKGKVLTGTVRKDLTLDEAKALDPYAFKKDGGYFIRAKPDDAAKPTPPSARPPSKRVAEAEARARDLAEYFTPGKTVQGYGGTRDMVVAFHPGDASGNWSVDVQEVMKDGSLGRARNHATLPTAREIEQTRKERVASTAPTDTDKAPAPQSLPEVTQAAADQSPPEPLPPLPPEPVVADAVSLGQGRGPVPVTIEPTDKIGPKKTPEISDDELAAGMEMLEDPEQRDQVDHVLDLLAKGWSPTDISELPGIDFTSREIDVLSVANTMDEADREIVRPERNADRGLQSALHLGDEGEGPEGVPEPDSIRPDGGTPPGEVGGGASDAPATSGQSAKGRTRRANRGGGGGGGRTSARDPDRLPSAGERAEPRDAQRPPQERAPDTIEGTNYVIEPGALAESRTRLTKARDNLAAIELAKRIKTDGQLATRAEQEILAKYVGWGGIKNVFRDSVGQFGKGMEDVGARLEQILTPAEYRAANATVNNAHYTAEHVVRSMWEAVRQMGFTGGSVFEPGMGVGHFLGLMPQDIAAQSTYRGIERDLITTEIAQLLYPRAGVRQADFTRMALPEQAFDLVIGNPPFLDVAVSSDKKYPQRFMLHDYFFAKSMDAVRPGGLLAFVTSAGTMNKLGSEGREYLAARAEFLGGVRLPSSAFRQNAGTAVTTDILFFKRRPEGKVSLMGLSEPELIWTHVAPRALPNAEGTTTEGNVNQYFIAHPEMVLGQEGFFDKLYKDRYAVHQTPDTDLPTDLRAAVDRLPRDVMTPEPTPEQKATLDFSSTEKKDGSFYVKDGKLMQYSGGAGREVLARGKGVEGGFTAADRDRVIKLIPVRDALRQVFAADLAEDDSTGAAARKKLNAAYDDFVKWFGPINQGTITFKRPSIIQQESARVEAREEARFVGDRFVEGDFDATPMHDAKAKIGEIARARDASRQVALSAGKPFNEGSFDPNDMPDAVIERRPNIRPFMSDPESYRLRSIESYDDSTNTATKKAIFTRSILTHDEEPKINSAHDGVLWSLNRLGRFDIDAIAEKMGKTPSEIVSELGDDVFRVPGTDGTYQTKDEYLSGDVITKLEQARQAAQGDPDLLRNVTALEAAAPRPLSPSRISMVIGMPWIPPAVVSDFVAEHLQLGTPRISYSEATGTWIVENPERGRSQQTGYHVWSTPRRNAYQLLSDALNRTPPRIMTPGSRDNPPVFDPVATQAAQDKMAQMRDAFYDPETRSGWVLTDQTRANELADLYNAKLNREVLRQFDGSYLTTPGVAASWSWRPHQTRVVSRIILEGNTYMAHAVGAGKTSAMIGAGMEMKRLGLVRKPMYAVPNHMLGQFTKEFYEQYPTARIAVADEERFHTDRRKQFIANVAQDDLDAVIITHSSFQKVPISDEFQADLIQEQIDMLEEAMSQLDPQADRITVGRMNKQREKLEQRLSKASGTEKDQTLSFEEMGVDFLFVDEAHLFRKLSFATKQGQMKGISPDGSNMSWDLFTKVRYLDSQRPGRSVVFASGTPITNTMGELYSLSRFMQPDALKARGLSHFDAWAQTFGTTKSTLEETAAGTYQPMTRFGKFVNMPELYKMVGGVMDIVTPSQLEQYVTRPQLKGGKREFHMAPRSEILDRYQAGLAARMEAIKRRRGPPEKGDDILLSVINDGRHAAIDTRFVEESQNDPTSKLNMLVDNVARIYHETGNVQFFDPGSGYANPSFRGPATQMVFANLGVNGRGPMGFSGYRWIKEGLRRAGVPIEEIAFIGDYGSTIARQKLFNDMNEGKVRILIGSTQKMGTGVNAQRRLIAVHNQDPLWFPADDEQRNGRILRQGNHNPEIQIHDYTTKGTYDSAMWQMMAKKAGFIEQFFRGDPTLRDMEDVGEASMYEQASAMSTTDERILTLTELKQDLDKARRRQAAHDDEQWALRTQYRGHLTQAQHAKEKAERYAKDIDQRVETTGKKFSMQVAGQTFTVRKEALDALRKEMDERALTMGDGTSSPIGDIGGFRVRLFKTKRGHWLELMTGGAWDKSLSSADPIASAEDRIRHFELDQRNALADETRQRADAAAIEPHLGKPFEGGDEIARLDAAVRDLTAILEGEAKAAERAKSGENPDDADDSEEPR